MQRGGSRAPATRKSVAFQGLRWGELRDLEIPKGALGRDGMVAPSGSQ